MASVKAPVVAAEMGSGEAVLGVVTGASEGAQASMASVSSSGRRGGSSGCSRVLVEVPPKVVFINVLKSLEISDPVFTTVGFPGAYQVHIEFYSDLPFARTPIERDVKLVGDICSTPELAESSAIKRAFGYLEYKHNVKVDDLSTVKIGRLEWAIREANLGVRGCRDAVADMIDQWNHSLDILYRYRKHADKKVQFDSVRNDFTMEGYILGQFRQLMESASAGQMNYIRSTGDELRALNGKHEMYKESLKGKFSGGSKAFIKKAFLTPKDLLRYMLNYFYIDEAKFCTTESDYKVFDEETGMWCKPKGYDMLVCEERESCYLLFKS
ncbi:hypothetical protein ACP4OV_004252 [Aristida adscensionis]